MKKIKTSQGDFYYKNKTLYLGIKPIDKQISKQNLLEFQEIAQKHDLFFGIFYGTLLGAIREQDFITHDEDIDLFILKEDENKLFDMLFSLKNAGFELIRFDRRGVLSIMKNNEYIDLYIFSKYIDGIRKCGNFYTLEKFFYKTTTYEFCGSKFVIPKDYIEFFELEYGANWKSPIPFTDFKVSKYKIYKAKIQFFIYHNLPLYIYILLLSLIGRKSKKTFFKKLALLNFTI